MRAFLLASLVLLVVVSFLGLRKRSMSGNATEFYQRGAADKPLFVIVPGMSGVCRDSSSAARTLAQLLGQHGSTLILAYPSRPWSNANPESLAKDMSLRIGARWSQDRRQPIVLVGHSMGALLLRQAYLEGRSTWGQAVTRIVLLAGMNRGWDASGEKPADMGVWRRAQLIVSSTLGRLVGAGQLVLDMEAGAPFVANLRLAWMEATKSGPGPEVVQLLGDIDDLVSDEDNKDVAAVQVNRFAWLRVRGTGHASIVEVAQPPDPAPPPDQIDLLAKGAFGKALREYRGAKLLLAATRPFADVLAASEKQTFAPNPAVTDVVFVLHGIRDLGTWSSLLEEELHARFSAQNAASSAVPSGGQPRKLAVVAARYGYFGMGPFVLHVRREKFVRWFMDSYTETLARYPSHENVHFFGHSNGTYLLAAGLARYDQMKVEHVAFAGSVVPATYEWGDRFKRGQATAVRNYVASDDWVVALFPRFFEYLGGEPSWQ